MFLTMCKKTSYVASLIFITLLVFIEFSEGDKEPLLFFLFFVFWLPFSLAVFGVACYRLVVRREYSFAFRSLIYVSLPYVLVVIMLLFRCALEWDVLRYLGVCIFEF